MASQQELLSALQGLSQQSSASRGRAPAPVAIAPTTRTSAPPRAGAGGAPNLFDQVVKQSSTMASNPRDAKTRTAIRGLDVYAKKQGAKYPNVLDEIQAAKEGQVKPSGALGVVANVLDNPIAKTILAPLVVLDTGRRGIISGIREVTDILDSDEKTTASFSDWFDQTKDATYGFGTAFPMKGWGGRIVGLIGDLALDPINWLTLGASIPKSLASKGVSSALIKGAAMSADELAAMGPTALARMAAEETARVAASKEGVKLRTLLGRRQSGRGFATNLAGLADKMGASAELVQEIGLRGRQAFGRSEEGIQLAKKIGLPEPGIYVMGTQVKVPFTGPVAEMIERGLVGSRIGIMGSRSTEWLAENFTTKGTSASRNMQPLRRGLRTGKLVVDGRLQKMDAELARYAVRLESMDNAARSLEGVMMDTYGKRVAPFLQEEDIKAAGTEVYKFLDTPRLKPDGTMNWERELTDVEQRAYDKIQKIFKDFHSEVEARYQTVDPNFQMNYVENYLPHMMTDEARDWLNSLSTQRAEEIRQYLKINMTDPSSSFKSRGLIKDATFFGKVLDEEDMLKGVAGLNEIATMPGTGFTGKFFETDIDRIMSKYGQHYAQQFGTAEFMRLAVDGGILAEAKQMGTVTKDWLKSTADYARSVENAMNKAHGQMADAGRASISAFTEYMDGLASKTGEAGLELAALKQGLKEVGTPEQRLLKLQAAQKLVDKAIEQQKKAWYNFTKARNTTTAVIDGLSSMIDDLDTAWDDLSKSINQAIIDHPAIMDGLNMGQGAGGTPIVYNGKNYTYDELIKSLDLKHQRAANALKVLEESFERTKKLDNLLNGIYEGYLKNDGMDDLMENITQALLREGIEIPDTKVMNTRNIGSVWSDGKISPDMRTIKSVLDPTGKIKNSTLSKLTIEEVRRRASSAVTSSANLRDLREAGIWLVVRDALNDPEFASLLAKDIKNIGSTVEGATQSRYANLIELLRQADATERYMFDPLLEKGQPPAVISLQNNIEESEGLIEDLKKGLDEFSDEEGYFGDVPIEAILERVAEEEAKITKWQKRLNNLSPKTNPYEVTGIAKANELNGFRDVIADLGAGISEYYLHRETYHRMKSLQDALATTGIIVDQKNYNKILAEVAKPELQQTIKYQQGLLELEEFFSGVRTRVNAIGKGKMSDSAKAELREDLLSQQVSFPEMVLSSSTRKIKNAYGNIVEESVTRRTGRMLQDGPGRWREGPNGKDKIWAVKLSELEAQGASKQQIEKARQELLNSTHRYAEIVTERKQVPAQIKENADVFQYQFTGQGRTTEGAVMKPTGRTIIEEAGEWGPRKQELFEKQTRRSSDITRSIILQEELSKIFRVEPVGNPGSFQPKEIATALRTQELIREHLPELEAVWYRQNIATTDRLFYRHPESAYLEEKVLELLRRYGKRPAWGRPSNKQARVVNMKGGMQDSGLSKYSDVKGYRKESISSAGQYDKLRGNILAAIQELNTAQLPYQAKRTNSVKKEIKELQDLYDKIVKETEVDQKIAQKVGKRLTGQSSIKNINASINKAIKGGKQYGFSSILKSAFNGNEKGVADLFAELLGGQTYDFAATRGVRQYRDVQVADSYFGRLMDRTSGRVKGLRVLTDETNIPLDVLLQGNPGHSVGGKYIPGSWLLRTELRGANASADFLEEYADELLRRIDAKKTINTAERTASREVQKLEGQFALPFIGEPKTGKPFISRLSDEVEMEIPDQGRIMRQKVREEVENDAVLQQLDELAATPEYARAVRREGEHRFAMVLAKLDSDTARELGFTSPEFEALWNNPLKQVNIGSLRSQLNTLEKTRTRLVARRNIMVRRYGNEFAATNLDVQLERVENLLLQVEEEVLSYDASASALNKLSRLYDNFSDLNGQKEISAVLAEQRSAPLKFKTGPDGEIALGADEALQQLLNNSGSRALSTDVDSRLKYLQKARLASDEYKTIKGYKEVEQRLNFKMQREWANQRSNVLSFQDRIRARVDGMRGRNIEEEANIARLEQQIIDELEPTGLKARATGGAKLATEAKTLSESLRTRPKEPIAGAEWEGLSPAEIEAKLGGMGVETGPAREGKFFRADSGAIEAGTTPAQLEIAAKTAEKDEIFGLLEGMKFKKIVEEGREKEAIDSLSKMTNQQRSIIANRMKAVRQLEDARKVQWKLDAGKDKRKLLGAVTKRRSELASAQDTLKGAQQAYDSAVEFAEWAPEALEDARKTVTSLKDLAIEGRKVRATINRSNVAWNSEVNKFIEDASGLLNSIDGDDIPNSIRSVITDYTNKQAEYFKQSARLTEAQEELMLAKGLKGRSWIAGTDAAGKLDTRAPIAFRDEIPEDAYEIVPIFDKGFVQLSKYFPTIGVREELASIVQSVHRLNEPQVVREMNKFIGKYTRFFKAYATLSPGFHARNAMSNSFMIFAAGAKLKWMNEGLDMSRSWLAASRQSKTVDQWVASLPANMQEKARTAMEAFFASGGGMSTDFFDISRVPRGTKKSKELGKWVENHSRFVLAWDGVSQGLDMNAASTRVRKYLIDYADVSTGDQLMRQIVPFWMWTSRNLPLQLGNMWLNPKAYAIYNTIKRNVDDEEEGAVVPQWMREIGAFKLPFGNNLYATPDFGFNRVGQQVQELSDPQRLLSNVNPLIRVPLELMGGRQLYNNRQFSDKPVEVGNGAGAILQPFLAAAGYGETRDGKQFVDDKAYYAIRNLIPFLGTAERLTPSIDTYQQRGYVNPLLGFLGVPGRQVKEQEIQSELARRKGNIAKITSREKAFGE